MCPIGQSHIRVAQDAIEYYTLISDFCKGETSFSCENRVAALVVSADF
jgi:hypothetical protein